MSFLKLEKESRINIFTETARSNKVSVAAVEKDWWVVKVLFLVFQLDFAKALVFKGGTSLSKGWDLINRFSEDIDLSLDRSFLGFKGDLSRKQINKLRKQAASFIDGEFKSELHKAFKDLSSDVEITTLNFTQSDQDPLVLEIKFPSVLENYKYLKPSIKLEIGCRALIEPFTYKPIKSMLAERFSDADFVEDTFEVPCVNPERTMLEKIFLLHEEFQKTKDKIRVDRLSRHIYDIHQLYAAGYLKKIQDAPELYKTVVEHRSRFNTIKGIDYSYHRPSEINPLPPESVHSAWASDYKSMLEEMIFGDNKPDFVEILNTLQKIKSEIVSVGDFQFNFTNPS